MERRASPPVNLQLMEQRAACPSLPRLPRPSASTIQFPSCYFVPFVFRRKSRVYLAIPREATTRGTSSAFPLCKLRNAASRIS